MQVTIILTAFAQTLIFQADTSNKENDEPSAVLSDTGHGDRSGLSTISVTSPVTSPLSTPRDSDREDKRGRSIARRSTNKKQVRKE